jgi:cytochrome c-type biogenesis protein CcmE
VDLSPRSITALDESVAPPAGHRRRRWGPVIVLVLVLAGGAVVVGKFLTSAIDYYCNADEVGVKNKCSGDRRLRVQGKVEQGSLVEAGDGSIASFVVSFNGAEVPVDYSSGQSLPDLFQECIPVVVAGRLRDGSFEGTSVEVKHSNEYQEANGERIDQAESAACLQQA